MNSYIFILFDSIYFVDFYASVVTQRDVVMKKNVLMCTCVSSNNPQTAPAASETSHRYSCCCNLGHRRGRLYRITCDVVNNARVYIRAGKGNSCKNVGLEVFA